VGRDMVELLTGTVTFLFTDIEGSTLLVRELGDRYGEALAQHRRLIREAVEGAGGREIDTQGDSFFVAFASAKDALHSAVDAQRLLMQADWPGGAQLRVRMGIHTGEPAVGDEGYLGLDVHRAARICAAAHGGQILVSETTRALLLDGDSTVEDLGEHRLKGLPRAERIFQVVRPDLPSSFPALKTLDRQEADASPFLGRERELGASAHAAVAAAGRVAETVRRRLHHPGHRGFADLGWEVRALLPSAPSGLQEPLGKLGGDLFTLGRSVVACDRYVAGIDRKRLDGRLAEYREMAVVSRRAAAEAEALEAGLQVFDGLVQVRGRLTALAEDVERGIEALRRDLSADGVAVSVETLRSRIEHAAAELDEKTAAAHGALREFGAELKRTRHRGVFRVGRRYAVPFFDELGIEQRREFDSLAEARAFRKSVRLVDERRDTFTDSSMTALAPWGAEKGIVPPRRGKR
jgi:class 3 adenylate cyclase